MQFDLSLCHFDINLILTTINIIASVDVINILLSHVTSKSKYFLLSVDYFNNLCFICTCKKTIDASPSVTTTSSNIERPVSFP